ncbi:MAG: UvrD-helicase domain-containing protein [Myxococcota bacterium]
MKWEDLTPDQQQAVMATEPRVIVFGGAGSGKTTVALWGARHFLRSPNAKPWHRVLFLTFSRTAVREIARRSGRALTDVREKVEIHTFHAFANRMVTAFGRYAGLGRDLPPFRSDAEGKLLGKSARHLSYDDLLPLALKVIRTPRVRDLVGQRWPLVVCDEFQDTDNEQWELLVELAACGARLLMLADPNQMIYAAFLGDRGVGPHRVEGAIETADHVIDLGAPSHRDPTNVIPAMAAAIRRREFDHEAVEAALRGDRLRVHRAVPDDDLLAKIRQEVDDAWNRGHRSIGIFGHSNRSVAELSASLFAMGLDHVLVGLPEAHGEALAALEAACQFGAGHVDFEQVRLRLAVFLTASIRGSTVPELALGLKGATTLPPSLVERLNNVQRGLQQSAADGVENLVNAAMNLWPSLGIAAANRPWNQAARTFGALARQAQRRARARETDAFFTELARSVSDQRTETLFEGDGATGKSIQLMNFHQTKGREADVVILVYRDADWFGREQEPFPTNSRLLYVSLTRARQRNIVILPPTPHALVAPFADLPAVAVAPAPGRQQVPTGTSI